MTNTKNTGPFPLTRRGLVVGGALAAAGAPFVRPLQALAQPTIAPRRVLFFFKPVGVNELTWFPSQPGRFASAAALTPALQPLAPYYDRLLVLDGVDMTSCIKDPIQPGEHNLEASHLWTGIKVNPASAGVSAVGGTVKFGFAGGQSIDQYLAAQKSITGTAPLPSLDIGFLVEYSRLTSHARMSFSGPGQPITPRSDPAQVFTNVFGGGPVATDGRGRLLRTSILGRLRADLRTLKPRLAPSHRPVLDAHEGTVEALEKGLVRQEAAAQAGGACKAKPGLGTLVDPKSSANVPTVFKQQLRIMAAAFACDITRVGTFMAGGTAGEWTLPWLAGVSPSRHIHNLAHMHGGEAGDRPQNTIIDRWYMEHLKFFLDELKALDPTGELRLLDNTMVVMGSEHMNGQHIRKRIPFMVVNGLGHLKTGQAVRYWDGASWSQKTSAGRPHNDFLVSVANAMGAPITTFGDPALCTGPLSGIT